MLNIDYIKILPGCHDILKKNLEEGHEYRFNESLDENFFGHNISLHAIVGKNGSGKSSLLEIMFRLINNLSYNLVRHIPRNAADDICYIFGLYAEMGWSIDGKHGVLRCEDAVTTFGFDGTKTHKMTVEERAGQTIFRWDYTFEKEYKLLQEIADNFFYTIVLNYSLQSYVAQDYIGEEMKSGTSNKHKSWDVKDVWINALFHKNDGYMCPINLNPYRDRGHINMNKEMRLTRERVASLLEYYKQEGRALIDDYELHEVIYTYTYEKVNNYFDSQKVVDLLNMKIPTSDEGEFNFRQDSKDVAGNKNENIRRLFSLVLASENESVTTAILREYGIDMSKTEEEYVLCMIYVVCKTLNIGLVYPKYLLLTGKGDSYTAWDALSDECTAHQIDVVKKLVVAIKQEDSHITSKLKKAVRFLKNYDAIKAKLSYCLTIPDENGGFSSVEYREALGIPREKKLTLKEIEDLQPAGIYDQNVMMVHKNQEKPIELSKLSSGERQFVFTLSALIYHLTNLLSVKDGNTKYHCFNLVLDELEICLHPDYQRMFVSRMLNLLVRLGFNQDPYRLNIILCTHSPFTLSDIPKQNIIYMEEGKDVTQRMKQETFGANVNELLAESFFLSKSFMGEFARCKITDLIDYLQGNDTKEKWDDKKALAVINQIGDPLIVQSLLAIRNLHTQEEEDQILQWHKEQIRLIEERRNTNA